MAAVESKTAYDIQIPVLCPALVLNVLSHTQASEGTKATTISTYNPTKNSIN